MSDRAFRPLAAPWGLPASIEAKLTSFIEDDDPEAVSLLLTDEAFAPGRDPRLLAMLAHAKLELARTRVGLEQAVPLLAEAKTHLDSAREQGVDPRAVDALEDDVTKALDQASRRELAVLHAAHAPDRASDEDLEDAAWVLEKSEPARAADLFDRLADRQGAAGFDSRVRAALARFKGGDEQRARPILEEALDYDWKNAEAWAGRLITESAFTTLLADAANARDLERFQALWSQALERMNALGVRFPAVWANQKQLLDLCLLIEDGDRANYVGRRIREAWPWVPRALQARLMAATSLKQSLHS